MKKIKFFKGKDCPNCPVVEAVMKKSLGSSYDELVDVTFMDDEDGFLDAMMANVKSAPSVIIEGNIWSGAGGTDSFKKWFDGMVETWVKNNTIKTS